MSLGDDSNIVEYMHRSDSPFELILGVSSIARDRCKEWEGLISESEALTWVMQNKEPEIVKHFKGKVPSKQEAIDYRSRLSFLKDFLSQIDDEDMRQAVKDSYITSLHNKNLVYKYNDIKNSASRARVRVLVKMLWNIGMK